MSKLSNVLTMLQLLQNKRKYSIKELSLALEVSPRMIRQYKEELEYAGIYIDTIYGPYGGYILNQDITIPQRFVKKENIKLDNKELYNQISRAIKKHHKCYIEYYSLKHDEITKRVIRPYNLMVLENEWGVAAFCEKSNDIRHFYLNRISLFKELDDEY